MATFEEIFPTFLQKCSELRQLLFVVAYMLFIVGVIVEAGHRPAVSRWLRFFVRLLIAMALLVFLPQWGDRIGQIVNDTATNGLGAKPEHVYDLYRQTLEAKTSA